MRFANKKSEFANKLDEFANKALQSSNERSATRKKQISGSIPHQKQFIGGKLSFVGESIKLIY